MFIAGTVLLGFLLIAIVGVLLTGMVLMAKGGEANEKYSNKLMTARVTLQGAAIVVAVLLFAAKH